VRPAGAGVPPAAQRKATDAITLHQNSVARSHPSLPGVPVFDDANSYWNSAIPTSSVKVPHTGTTIRIQSVNSAGFIQVRVN